MKIFLILAVTLFIAGCNDTYRYPCQNPVNWDEPYCKKPICSANGTCPEDLKHYEKPKTSATPAPQQTTTNTGVCK